MSGRVVDCSGLENRQPRKGFVSSKLTSSANFGKVAEWLKAPDCKSGSKESVVQIHPFPPSLSGEGVFVWVSCVWWVPSLLNP